MPFHISTLDILVIAIYMLATLGLGLYQAFKIRTSGDYYARLTGVILAGIVAKDALPPEQVAQLGKDREIAFGLAMQRLLPHGLLGLMFAAIFASQMATLSAQMVNSSALASRNLYKELMRPQASDHEVLIFGRVCGLALVGIGVFLALRLTKVANALTMLLQFSSIMGVLVWAGVLFRRASVWGAWAGVSVLFTVWAMLGPLGMLFRQTFTDVAVPNWIGEFGREQFVFELMIRYLAAGIGTMILVSLLTPAQNTKQFDNLRMLLKTPVGQEQKLLDAGVPIVYTGSAVANPLEAKYPRLVHWGGFALAAGVCVLIVLLLKFLATLGA